MRGLVFAGQGSHRTGMSMSLLECDRVVRLWEEMKCCMRQNYGVDLQHIMQGNPRSTHLHRDAMDSEVIVKRPVAAVLERSESYPRPLVVTHCRNVLSRTFLTQPCVVAAELLALERLKSDHGDEFVRRFAAVAGHSLGELTALTALGVFAPTVALNLAYIRGLLMEDEFIGNETGNYMLFACNPAQARLDTDDESVCDDMFFVIVELIARALALTSSFLEVVNMNTKHTQYVVAGDMASLAILGKCLDPQFRAQLPSTSLQALVSCALNDVLGDEASHLLSARVNDKSASDFVSSSKSRYGGRALFRRFMRGPDDGFTPSLDELTHLTLEEDGRSGLKRKSWFVPLPLDIPFHSSRLRRCADRFLPVVRDALPDEQSLRKLLSCRQEPSSADSASERHDGEASPRWVTNLTGTVFCPFDSTFQKEALEAMQGQNIGEVWHKGRYRSDLIHRTFSAGVQNGSVADMCAAVVAMQITRQVWWTDVMDTMVIDLRCTDILEVSPQKTLADMFRRTKFVREDGVTHAKVAIDITASCFP